jgi:monofunctional chorismate mutase
VKQENENEGDWPALEEFREEIDSIDGQIISLLNRRQEIAAQIGKIKRDLGIEVIDLAREEEVLRRLASKEHKSLNSQAIRNIFSEVISAARSVQQIPLWQDGIISSNRDH